MHAVDRVTAAYRAETPEAAWRRAVALFDEDVALCEVMARYGAALVHDGEGCSPSNAGALATVGVGTALGVVTRAWAEGKRVHVFVDETRLIRARASPRGDAPRGRPHTLLTDSMAAVVMRRGRVQRVFVGPTAWPPTGTSPTRSAPTAWRCSRSTTGSTSTRSRPPPRSTSARDGDAIPIEDRDRPRCAVQRALSERFAGEPGGCARVQPVVRRDAWRRWSSLVTAVFHPRRSPVVGSPRLLGTRAVRRLARVAVAALALAGGAALAQAPPHTPVPTEGPRDDAPAVVEPDAGATAYNVVPLSTRTRRGASGRGVDLTLGELIARMRDVTGRVQERFVNDPERAA